MSKHVEEWVAATPVPHKAHQPSAGLGRNIQGNENWDGKVLSFEDLFVQLPPGGGPVLGQATVALRGVRRLANPGGGPPLYAQRRVGWVAQRDRVVVVESHRRVEARADGKFRAVGGWAPATVELLDASRLPDRTQGEIPDDSISGNRGKMQGATGAATATDRQATDEILVTGRDALQYLPHEIRLGVSQAIPSPEFHVGGAVRWTDTQGQISRHEVNLMAMQGQRAVVVMASTQGRSGWWQADQITYDFVRPVGEALPGVTAAGAIGR